MDEEFTEPFNSDRYEDVTVYAKWVEGSELDISYGDLTSYYDYENNEEYVIPWTTGAKSPVLEGINVGDTLYFWIYNPTNEAHYYDDFYFYSVNDDYSTCKISNIVSGTITSKETKLVSYTLTEDDNYNKKNKIP